MKKLLLLLLLFTGMVKAQIVNIPDANFKNALLSANSTGNNIALMDIGGFVSIDTNLNGEIEYSEAALINGLFIGEKNISDLTGIEAFVNLTNLVCGTNPLFTLNTALLPVSLSQLNCYNCNLTSLDVSTLPNLISLDCSGNQLTSLDVSNHIGLTTLFCSGNSIGTLNLSGSNALYQIYCESNNLGSLNLSGLVALNTLYCSTNNLDTLDLTGLSQLQSLGCGANALTSLDVSQLSNLTYLDCNTNQINSLLTYPNVLTSLNYSNNQLPNLDFTNLTTINWLNCGGNGITNLDLSHFTNLGALFCGNNLITSIDFSNALNLITLDISYNPFTSLDTTSLTNLNNLFTQNSLITTIDTSSLTHINQLVIGGNSIQTINIKNGTIDESLYFIDSVPNLQFICADEQQALPIQTALNNFGSSAVVNSYCYFTPGGNYNTITGNIKYDLNNDGCDPGDISLSNIRVNISDFGVALNAGSSYSNLMGNYYFYTLTGNFMISPQIENASFFNSLPVPINIEFSDTNNNIVTQDFCISANGIHHDVEMVIMPITPARPGFDAVYKLVYKNKGNQIENIVAPNFYFNDSVLDYVSSSIIPTSSGLGFLQWSLPPLLPFQSGEITITLNVNAPTDVPAVNIGDILEFSSIIDVVTDENWSDNNFTYNQTVVGSFDPNDITCLEGERVAPSTIGEYLHYAINFENTGNYPAENIVVKTTIDPTKFDINSLQLLNTSHPVNAKITGNVVEFIFENIQLNGPGGHGHILLKIKSDAALVTGDSVSKRADIFFDYNAPIDTGLANTIFQSLSNPNIPSDASISIFPNPAKDNINVICNSTIKSIQLFDIQGRVLLTKIVDYSDATIDISNYSNGIHFLKITTEKGIKIEEIVKK